VKCYICNEPALEACCKCRKATCAEHIRNDLCIACADAARRKRRPKDGKGSSYVTKPARPEGAK